ncbi:MAG TPA: magnesium chelatase domain-containing protein, partial [Acidobacteriota bacterium]|nr:magnesium chelatase domain-containing protein [Acidobacteriota bacterium]
TLMGSDVYVNVAGGLNLSEPAVDLPLVAAVASSFYDRPLPPDTVVIGEVGLAGEVRAVNQIHARVREAASLGFQRVLLPENNLPLPEPPKSVLLEGVDSVRKFLEAVGL